MTGVFIYYFYIILDRVCLKYEARVADATRAFVCASTAEAYGPTEERDARTHMNTVELPIFRPCSQSAPPSAHSN